MQRGAESRKKNVLCHLAASSKGNIDTDMKNFLEDLVQASLLLLGEIHVSTGQGKIETEAEVTKLVTTLVVTELVGKSDQASSPSMTKINSGPSTSKKAPAPSKKKGIKKYTMDPLLLQYGKDELPSHGRTRMLWNVDVDRMYVPVWVNCNHWIALCISFVTRNIQVFDCGHLHITPHNVSYVPMSGLNRLQCHCGVYTIKHLECHALGLDISMVSDENIRGARIKIMWDLWEAANGLELI
ncbi:hypothetical protein Bca52824_089425 [Brassica carinata]|uniref:Ubiquitin-like protease family profile domain-containing protein n=1 Tax=Brassica carinata TaxID=52824 RepID=A0A8X7TPR9_BRACI|nr:hypothetical protein Bca52824_089425 [Brassica carinata]